MARDKAPGDSTRQLKQDRLVENLIPNPSDPRPTIQLTGWLGKSSKEGCWRLYLTPQLSEYVQFLDTAVVHSQPVPEDQSPLGGTMIWLDASTPLEYTQIVQRQVQADFLSGGITSEYLPGTASDFAFAGPAARQAAAGTRDYRCSINPHIPVCQERTQVCPINSGNVACGTGPFCGSGAFVCGASAGCTWGRECSVRC